MGGFIALLDLLISNIQEVDLDTIQQVAETVPKSQASYYSQIFDFILSYQTNHKELPSPEFLEQSFRGIWTRTTEKLSKEAINILLYELRKNETITDTMLALQAGDIDKARLSLEGSNTKAEYTETTVDQVCGIYDSRDSMPEGLQTGVRELDNVLKNLSYGTNNFIAAPPKCGKTTAAISLAYDGLMHRGMNVVYLTLEVKPEDIFANLFARHAKEIGTNLNAQKIKLHLLDENERQVLGLVQQNFIEFMEKVGGHISVIANHDLPEMTIPAFKRFLDTKAEEWGSVDLVVIDHCNLLQFYKMKGVADAKERINTWIKATTDMAKGFQNGTGFILVSLMQINRQGANLLRRGGTPSFEILADANEAERSAHTCTVLYSNPEMIMSKQVRCYLLANRNGAPLVTDQEDNSLDTYLDPTTYTFGHRKYGDTISLKNKDLLKPSEETQATDDSALFSSMI